MDAGLILFSSSFTLQTWKIRHLYLQSMLAKYIKRWQLGLQRGKVRKKRYNMQEKVQPRKSASWLLFWGFLQWYFSEFNQLGPSPVSPSFWLSSSAHLQPVMADSRPSMNWPLLHSFSFPLSLLAYVNNTELNWISHGSSKDLSCNPYCYMSELSWRSQVKYSV